MYRKQRISIWEVALACLLVWYLGGQLQAERQQQSLADKVVRLHVLANSDSPSDQALKLQVKDCVFYETEALLSEAEGRETAVAILQEALPHLKAVAEEAVERAGRKDSVRVTLEETNFPRKNYTGFSFPEGEYLALRVILGEGEGQNWWCVVYPPLCLAGESEWKEVATENGLTEQDIALIDEEQPYVLSWRGKELWKRLR